MSEKEPAKSVFRFGPYVPIVRSNERIIVNARGVVDYYNENDLVAKKFLSEILPGDSILEAPSMVVPFLLKKNTIWPPKVVDADQNESTSTAKNDLDSNVDIINRDNDDNVDDDIQLVKIVDRREKKFSITPKRTKDPHDYARASVVKQMRKDQSLTLSTLDNHHSSANDLLLSIGLSQVQEFVLEEKFKKISLKVKRGSTHLIEEVQSVKSQLMKAKMSNCHYKAARIHRCPHCPFRTESLIVLNDHLEEPHKNRRILHCNWCSFKTKDRDTIIYHSYIVHKKRCRVDKSGLIHYCQYCEFETKSKVKHTRHVARCEFEFDPTRVQASNNHDNHPAITSKFITQEDIRAYDAVLKDLRLSSYNPHQFEVNLHDSQKSILLIPRTYANPNPRTAPPSINQLASPFTSNAIDLHPKAPSASPAQTIAQNLMVNGASSSSILANKNTVCQNPNPASSFSNGILAVKNAKTVVMAPTINKQPLIKKTQTSESTTRARMCTSGQKHKQSTVRSFDDEVEDLDESKGLNDSFLICEICDTYIEGFKEFKSHMREAHLVSIPEKHLATSRPPLNCQKCAWRFYTDEGLQRHLLGSHGLVTANLQMKADNQADSGRCTVCGRKFANKLVAHMRETHKIILKPAQLVYKCKVCSATFGLYSLFENHVNQIHT